MRMYLYYFLLLISHNAFSADDSSRMICCEIKFSGQSVPANFKSGRTIMSVKSCADMNTSNIRKRFPDMPGIPMLGGGIETQIRFLDECAHICCQKSSDKRDVSLMYPNECKENYGGVAVPKEGDCANVFPTKPARRISNRQASRSPKNMCINNNMQRFFDCRRTAANTDNRQECRETLRVDNRRC